MKRSSSAWLVMAAATALMGQSAPATQPENPALRETSRGGWWATKHAAVLASNKASQPDLIYVGDSITQNYEKHQPPQEDFAPTWARYYAPRHAANLGYSGDTTGNVLWRLHNGEVDGISPKVAIVMIGTNNTAQGQTAAQVTEGIEALVALLHQKLPQTKVLLLAILPTENVAPADKAATDREINAALAKAYAGSAFVTVIDAGQVFFKDGKLDWSLFYDPTLPPVNGQTRGPLHPNTVGQRKMAEAIEPAVAKLMGDKPIQSEGSDERGAK